MILPRPQNARDLFRLEAIFFLAYLIFQWPATTSPVRRAFFDNYGAGIASNGIASLKDARDLDRSGELAIEWLQGSGLSTLENGQIPSETVDHYGSLTRGFLIAPQTGQYTFHMTADDYAEFYLDPNRGDASLFSFLETNAMLMTITSPSTGTDLFNPTDGPVSSSPVTLTAGKIYYFEILHLDQQGNSFFQIGWTLPNGTKTVIPDTVLLPYGTPESPNQIPSTITIDNLKAKYTVSENSNITLTATIFASQPASIQWLKNGVLVDSETGSGIDLGTQTRANNGDRFRLQITDANSQSTSSEDVEIEVEPIHTEAQIVVSGSIAHIKSNSPIQGASVTLAAQHNGVEFTSTGQSNVHGLYSVIVPKSVPFTLSAANISDSDNMAQRSSAGVDLTDLAMLRAHHLGQIPLTTPEIRLAADVDRSAAIDATDDALTKSLILNRLNAFPDSAANGSDILWRMLADGYSFTHVDAPWLDYQQQPAPNQIQHPGSDADIQNQNFKALKLGDLDQSWK